MRRWFFLVIVALLLTPTLGGTVLANPPAATESGSASIKMGSRGDSVRNVQKLLADIGLYSGTLDGIFGNQTLAAVKAFQELYHLSQDGTVGKETLAYLERAQGEPSRYSRSLTMRASAYSAQDPGNGNYTARGNLVRKGLVAVDTGVIPLGTRLYIPGYGFAIADDTGGSIRGNVIDLAFDTRSEALRFGVQYVTVYIL